MKLIIDIPEEEYNNIEPFLNGETIKGGFNLFKALEIIKNGIPLDDVKAEIDEQYDRIHPYNIDVAQGLEMALEILYNIGKAESEESK